LISPKNLDKHLDIFLDHRRFYIELSLKGIIDASVKFNDVIRAIAKEYSNGFIDSNDAILKNTQYFADNVHYTDEGAKVVASGFANYLKNRKLIRN
jgi:lysophospholipase L1-like esterase